MLAELETIPIPYLTDFLFTPQSRTTPEVKRTIKVGHI